MNKQDALTKLTALEADTKALRAIIEAPDVPAVPTRWRPLSGEQYWQVDTLEDSVTYSIPLRAIEYTHGNCFQTAAQAEIAAKSVSLTMRVCAAAFAVDPDAGEWIESERKWSVYKGSSGWHVAAHCADVKPIHVHTQEQAKQMTTILNAEGG
jgi:hypothetical protein